MHTVIATCKILIPALIVMGILVGISLVLKKFTPKLTLT